MPTTDSTFGGIKRGLLHYRPFRSFRNRSERPPKPYHTKRTYYLTPGVPLSEDAEPLTPTPNPGDSDFGKTDDDGSTAIMGKSNKFDFSNRPNSGLKLGNSIASALIKEADKIITKARKQSTDSSAASEKEAPSHLLDLQAPKKALGDEGVIALADGLEAALRRGNELASLALEDLNLSENGITVAALARLAPIIELARHALKTLNLSNNRITVVTDVEAQQWEEFLHSFKDCQKLRRLDLSDNPGLGRRAIEIFAKVHVNEPAVTPTLPAGDESVLSLVSVTSIDDTPEQHEAQEGDNVDSEAAGKSLSNAKMLKRRCGLRSIPYITLSNIGIDDGGALWLSYVLEDHYFPNQLTDDLNAVAATSTIKTYQQTTSATGVDWLGNQGTLGKEGLALLTKTETVRKQILLDDQSTLAGSLIIDGDVGGEDLTHTMKVVPSRRFSRSAPGDRRTSMRSIHTLDGGEHEASELESARRKIQRHIIEHDKPACMELWRAALTVVTGSRMILVVAPWSRRYFTGEALFPLPHPTTTATTSSEGEPKRADSATKLSIDTGKATSYKTSYAKTLSALSPRTPGEPELAITEVTNTPTTPKIIFKPHRKGAFSEGTDPPAMAEKLSVVTDKLNGLITRNDGSWRYVNYQQERTRSQAGLAGAQSRTAWRDISTSSHLPQSVVERILGYMLQDRALQLLSAEQRRAAFLWGAQRRSLETAVEWRKKDLASRVWLMLDSINCLAYGQ